ncbi:MAG: YjjG family noncanonical pyrimidine nucleotidase [Allomuricauda sp.]
MFRGKVTDIFFDLDHTLWDFERNSALTFNKILKDNGLNVDLDDFLEIYVPINFEYWKLYREDKVSKSELRYQRLKRTFDQIGQTVSDDMINLLAHEYIEYLPSFNHLVPNAVEILEYLSPKYKLHIITNGFQEIQEKKLKGGNIHHYFHHIINSEAAGVKKTHPYIFQLALDRAKATPQNSLMIGDNLEADIGGAKAVGMEVLHFNCDGGSNHSECPMINDLIEIKSIL